LQGRARPFSDQPSLFFGDRCVQVEHERVYIDSQFGHDELNPVHHQAGNEMHVAGKAVELADDYWTPTFSGGRESLSQNGPSVQRICAFTRLYLRMPLADAESLAGSKAFDGSALCIEAKS
jgi:hypothetical protein